MIRSTSKMDTAASTMKNDGTKKRSPIRNNANETMAMMISQGKVR